MPITQKETEKILKASPTDEAFAKAEGTLQMHKQTNKVLSGFEQQINTIYGPIEDWNPKGVVEAIKNYTEAVRTLIEKSKGIAGIDPLLGPKYLESLAECSGKITTYKNMARPWLEYITDKTTYGKVSAKITEESAKAQYEAAEKQIPELANLLTQLDGINAN